MHVIKIPKASENLEAATVGRWFKSEGGAVQPGEAVVEILTDKADFTVEADEGGILRRIAAPEKSTVPVGYVIGVIAGEDEELPDIDSENRRLIQAGQPRAEGAAQTPKPPPPGPKPSFTGRKVPATPAARRLARENDVALADVAAAKGKKGVVKAEDVEEYLQQKQ